MVKEQLIKSFADVSRTGGGFSKEPLAAGGTFAKTSDNKKKTAKINSTKKIEGDALNMLKSKVSEKKPLMILRKSITL